MTLTKKYYVEGILLSEGTEVLNEGDRYNNLILKMEGDTADAEQADVEKAIDPIMKDLDKDGYFNDNDSAQIKKDTVDYIKGSLTRNGKVPEKEEIVKFIVGRKPSFAK